MKSIKQLTVIFLICMIGLIAGQVNGANKKITKPNVIFILVDDVSPAWFPPYAKQLTPDDIEMEVAKKYAQTYNKGNIDLVTHIETASHSMPFLDKLSEKGVVFNHCFTTAALCAPSRSGILSASYQQRYGGYDNVDIIKVGIVDGFPLLTNLFKENGYRSAMIGKWHIGRQDQSLNKKGAYKDKRSLVNEYGFQSSCERGQSPLDQGFDYYFGYNNHASKYYQADDLWEGFDRVPTRPKGEFLTELLNEKALSFIETSLKNEKPFFIYYAPMTLHGRIDQSPEKYTKEFNSGVNFTDNYAGHLLALDEGIKNIYSVLEKYGQMENTLFVIASDNGAPVTVPPYNAPFKGGKGTAWLGGSHTPLIMVMPGQTKHRYIDDLVSTADIMPTALDFAGIKLPSNIDGKSLKPVLTGESDNAPHDMLFSSGLHSTRWSYSYIGEKNKRDSRQCPLYVWGITNENVLLLATETPKGLYQTRPDGLPAFEIFSDWHIDPKQSQDLSDLRKTEKKIVKDEVNDWLQQMAEPVLNHQDDYKELLEMLK